MDKATQRILDKEIVAYEHLLAMLYKIRGMIDSWDTWMLTIQGRTLRSLYSGLYSLSLVKPVSDEHDYLIGLGGHGEKDTFSLQAEEMPSFQAGNRPPYRHPERVLE